MTTEFTQGPWRVEYDGSLVIGGQIHSTPVPDDAGRSEKFANARLIAQSPAMYALMNEIASTGEMSAEQFARMNRIISLVEENKES